MSFPGIESSNAGGSSDVISVQDVELEETKEPVSPAPGNPAKEKKGGFFSNLLGTGGNKDKDRGRSTSPRKESSKK